MLDVLVILSIASIILILYLLARKELKELKMIHEELLHAHKSTLVKHGMSFEQLFPFMKNYPFDSRNFRFIGTPVDGISFENDRVVFVEFKTGKANLSDLQKKIKNLVQRKRVEWKEVRESNEEV